VSPARLELGRPVRCSDGPFGELADIVVDPVTRRITHLVVHPHQHAGSARLIPLELAESGDGTEISLTCTGEAAAEYPSVSEASFLRLEGLAPTDADWDVGVQTVLAVPSYSPTELGVAPVGVDPPVEVVYDRVPKGEVEIRRESAVVSADERHLGHVEAFLTDGGKITHVVLEHGHLWGKRDITIPIDAVASVENDVVTLTLRTDQIAGLPSVRARRGR